MWMWVGIVAVVGITAAVAATLAGADTPNTPAKFAHRASVSVVGAHVATPASVSALHGKQYAPGKGKGNGRSATLGGGEEVIAAVTGSLVPVAVETNDGSLVAYSSWQQLAQIKPGTPGQGVAVDQPVGRPSIRVYDAASGKDRLVAQGAYAPALSSDGTLAFAKGDDAIVRQNRDYTGRIMVGSARGNSFHQWTTDSARYFPYAWAGSTLLAYKAAPDTEAADLYAFTGEGQGRLLAAGAFVLALSPDGSRVAVTEGRRMVEILRVSDGAVQASMPLDGPGVAAPDAPATPHALMYGGSWSGDRIAANSDLGLVILDVRSGIEIESVLATPKFPHGIIDPTFVDATHVVAWADTTPSASNPSAREEPGYDQALVTCDLAAASCAAGASAPPRSWQRWIANPSR
jgi:hypothetical protein